MRNILYFFQNMFKLIVFALHYVFLYLTEAIFIAVIEINNLSMDMQIDYFVSGS